jgi:hypothetical protein
VAWPRYGCPAVLRDDAFRPELAGMREDRSAVAFEVLAVLDPGRRLGEQLFEPGLAFLERARAPVLAAEFQEVEGVEKGLIVVGAADHGKQ